MKITGNDKVFIGRDKETREAIYMQKPTYDCDWYWSFGFLGNKNCHYHLSGCKNNRNMSMYDCLKADYDLSSHIELKLWSFCEQAMAIYALKDAAEVLYRGGAHMTTHPLADTIRENNHNDYLNQKLLPILLQKFWDDFGFRDTSGK